MVWALFLCFTNIHTCICIYKYDYVERTLGAGKMAQADKVLLVQVEGLRLDLSHPQIRSWTLVILVLWVGKQDRGGSGGLLEISLNGQMSSRFSE